VVVRSERVDGRAIIYVEDDGPGIAPKYRNRVFERFFRVDKGRARSVGGTGLGLSIVRHLVESMGGEIRVEESSEGGACFVISLDC
jgi:signal transduction histidine kinase